MYKAVPPRTLKRILEDSKYELVAQDDANWIMESNGHVIVIPQTMKLVPEDVIETMLSGASGIDEGAFLKVLGTIEVSTAKPQPQQSPEQPRKSESR